MKKSFKRFWGTFLSVVIAIPTVSSLSGLTSADGVKIVQETECVAATVSEGFSFEKSEETFLEGSGTQQINLQRSGDIANASSVTIASYNFSAEYGKDYLVFVDGEPLQTAENTTSLYNQFRDNRFIAEREEVDNSMLAGLMEVQAMQAENKVDIVSKEAIKEVLPQTNGITAQTLEMMNELNVKATEWSVDFAEGQKESTITVEILEDAEPEYNEEFFFVLKSEDSMGENDLLSITIEDNEAEKPVNYISFSESQLSVDKESQNAEISFKREGNLATTSTILLCKDGTPYGYVTFNPYQETQIVEAEAGVYQMANPENCIVVEPAMLTVLSENEEAKETATVYVDDEDLDAVPEYSEVESATSGSNMTTVKGTPSWFPSWANNTSTVETDDYIIYMGSSSNELFKQGGTKKNGKATFDKNSNMYELSTSGTGSRVSTGYVYLDAKKNYDWTGIESVTGAYKVSGLDFDAEVKLGIHNVNANWISVKDGDSGEITCSIDTPNRDSNYVYYQNNDTTNSDDGCEIYVPNGFRMNKREYLFIISDPEPLKYSAGEIASTIDYGDSRQKKKIGSGSSNKSIVDIVYSSQDGYPQRLVGYNIVNGTEKKYVSLNGASSFTFDKQFLKDYEEKYVFKSIYENKEYYSFQIQPVFEKVAISSDHYEILPSELGTIKITSPSDKILYKGDKVVFEADETADGVKLSGVRVYGKSASNSTWRSGIVDVESDGKVYYTLSPECDYFKFQPVYNTDTDVLTVEYAEGAADKGTIAVGEGFVVNSDEYVINKYVPLIAKPNSDDYITKWTSNGRVYYGDVFNYQLDGIKENNKFVVDFVEKSEVTQSTSTLKINLYKENGSLSTYDNTYVYVPMKNTKCTINAGEIYTGYTDDNGLLTIENFTGVENGTYSIVIEDGSFFKYGTIKYSKNTSSYKINVAKFEGCSFYPNKVTMTQNGTSVGSNKLQLDDESYIITNVEIYNEVNSDYKLTSVKLLYYYTDDKGNLILAKERDIDLTGADTKIETLGKYTTIQDKAAANSLPENTKVYVSVTGEMSGENVEGYTATTEEIFTGYELIAEITDDSIPVLDDVANLPGAQSALSVNVDDLEVPFLGFLDFGINGKNGGYFVRQADPNDPSIQYLVAGFCVNSVYMKGTPEQKAAAAKGMYKDMEQAKENGEGKGDTSNTNMQVGSEEVANEEGEKKEGEAKKPAKTKAYGTKQVFSVYPAVMMKWGFKQVEQGGETATKLISLDAAFGFDQTLVLTKPFTIYGVPLYVTFTMKSEMYLIMNASYNPYTSTLTDADGKATVIYDQTGEDGITNMFFAVPYVNIGLKGGVGLNNFFDLYVTLDFSLQTMIEFLNPEEGTDGGFRFSYSGGIGGDLVIFDAELSLNGPPLTLGNQKLIDELKPITSVFSTSRATTIQEADKEITDKLDPSRIKFSLKERPNAGGLFRIMNVSGQSLSDNAFKGTNVQLIKLDNGSIMALLVADNGAPEGNANFLGAVYSISNDGGETWSSVQYVDKTDLLQFDINVFELADRLLITWSEGDAEQTLKSKDKDNLTAADVAKMLNSLNLKGCYYDKTTGEPIGKSFVIAENTNVAMCALDAMEDANGNVHVYYQRNKYEIEEGMTLEALTTSEHTVVQATQLAGQDEWTSTKVTATNASGDKQYRITEVVPFSHDGVNGEVLVIDRDGKLVTEDSTNGKMEASAEDRQIYIRFYSNDDVNTKSQIIPVTSPDVNAENVKVVSNENELYMFWQQDGRIYYLSDFVVSARNYNPDKCEALAVVDTDIFDVNVLENEEDFGMVATSHELLQSDSEYSVSMSQDGDVLLSFIASEQNEDAPATEDVNDIYGVIFETVDNNGLNELQSKGKPVALTDVNSPIRKMDSLYLGEDNFIVAYTKLDGTQKMNSTKATVEVAHNSKEAKLRIAGIDAPEFPLPGNKITVAVEVANDGLETLAAGKVVLSGLGETVETVMDEPLFPGEETTIYATLSVPEDFCKETTLKVSFEGTGEQSEYKAKGETIIKYDSYFVPKQMPYLNNIHGTNKYVSQLTVTNIGNKPGVPQITYNNFVNGSDSEENMVVTNYTYGEEVNPGGTVVIEHVLENTLAQSSQMTKMQVELGEGYDQKAEGILPAPVVIEGAVEGEIPTNGNTVDDNTTDNNTNDDNNSKDEENSQDDKNTQNDNSIIDNKDTTNTNNDKKSGNEQVKAAKTSDTANLGFVLALFVGSGVVLMLNVRRKRQTGKE